MKHWKEQQDIRKWRQEHGQKLRTYGGQLIDNLVCPITYCVSACGFIFRFASLVEIEEYIGYFQAKTHPSTRALVHSNEDHFDVQTKFTRLPARLKAKGRRPQIVKALESALEGFRNNA